MKILNREVPKYMAKPKWSQYDQDHVEYLRRNVKIAFIRTRQNFLKSSSLLNTKWLSN